MKTVLLSTSSLWNCGDEFIRDGILELLNLKSDVRTLWWNRAFGVTNTYANGLRINLPLTDYFIMAGTPQWIYNNETIYKYCLKEGIPMSIIGVGTKSVFKPSHVSLMKKVAESNLCELTLARDEIAANFLTEVGFKNVELILDPCFFKKTIQVDEPKLNLLSWRRQYHYDVDLRYVCKLPLNFIKLILYNNIYKAKKLSEMKKSYNSLMRDIFENLDDPKMVIIHDNREVKFAEDIFGKEYVFHSTDYNEIFKKYASAKNYIGSRIHGAIPALMHGSKINLVYANQKASVLNNSMRILKNYIPNIEEKINIIILNKDSITKDAFEVDRVDKALFDKAIDAEKLRIKEFISNTKILSTYTNR